MGRFVRIDKDKQKAVLLNLDLVATVELAPHSDLLSSNSDERRVNANFMAADKPANPPPTTTTRCLLAILIPQIASRAPSSTGAAEATRLRVPLHEPPLRRLSGHGL